MKTIWLRLIYTAHMLVPFSLALRHIERLPPDTAQSLRNLFS